MRFLTAILIVCSIMHFAHSKKAAQRSTSLVQKVSQKKWEWIANGSCPYIWMIHFYSQSEDKDINTLNKMMIREFTDATLMLKGIVQAGAYVVKEDFPHFIRIPSVLVYLPHSKQPLVHEMVVTKAQVKRPAYKLVEFIKDALKKAATKEQIIKSEDCENVHATETVPRADFSTFVTGIKGYLEDTSYLVYLTIAPNQEVSKGNVMCLKKIIEHGKNSENRHLFENVDFGWLDLKNYHTALEPYLDYLIAPGVALVVCMSETADSRVFSYGGVMNTVAIYNWARDMLVEQFDLPQDTTQLSVSKDAGDVGHLMKMGNTTMLFMNN